MPRSIPAVCCLVLLLSGPALAAGPFDDLLRYADSSTNVIALIDVKGALASPLAQKEKWAEKFRSGGRDGFGFLAMDAEQIVFADEVNLSTLTRDFQVALVKMRNVPRMNEL